MSEASINQVMKLIGYGGKITGHSFRHTLSAILHGQGFESAWIEMQLAHVGKNSIRRTYNHVQCNAMQCIAGERGCNDIQN